LEASTRPKDTGFYKECSQRVHEYFKKNGINYKSPVPGLVRLVPLFFAMAVTFYLGYISEQTIQARLICAVTYGVFQALNTVHLMHDASHGAVGNNEKWWWSVGRLTLDWVSGSSMVAWHNQHIVGHHASTNIF